MFANWKMYLDYDESNILANALIPEYEKVKDKIKMAVFPSALSFYPVTQVLKDVAIGVGAQNAHWLDKGGYTGEISALMYKNAGCEYALVGHSERRHIFYESNHDTQQKMEAVIASGLTPVLCVGETLQEKRDNKTNEVIEIQLRAALESFDWPADRELIIAYEPVWAIGTGESCDPETAEEEQEKIYNWARSLVPGVSPVLLYGGSVRPNNVADYLSKEHINGVLVGGASTTLKSWLEIIQNV